MRTVGVIALLTAPFLGCAQLIEVAEVTTPAIGAYERAQRPATSNSELLLFGGRNHDVFLGCLTCSEHETDAVTNPYGKHGLHSSASIMNPYSDYGSPYSGRSACSPYASDAPVVVDRAGNFYGHLTLNQFHKDAVTDATLLAWLRSVCEG